MNDPALLALLRQVPATGAWVRWSMLLLGGVLVGFPLLVWVWTMLPAHWFVVDGLPSPGGRITTAGYIFLALFGALGLTALRFSRRLFVDEVPYRQSPATLRRYAPRQGEVIGFGPWMNRFQRVRWRMGDTVGASPYVSLTLSIWLRPGDPAWIGVDPAGEGPPIFLGVRRATPEILTSGRTDLRGLHEALERHLAEGGDARSERLLKVWIVGRK